MTEKTRRWMLFSVFGSCFPVIGNVIGPLVSGATSPKLDSITEHGDLYLIGSALCAASLGELFGSTAGWARGKQYAGFAGMVAIFICTFAYARGSTSGTPTQTWVSILIQWSTFIASIVISLVCIRTSEAP